MLSASWAIQNKMKKRGRKCIPVNEIININIFKTIEKTKQTFQLIYKLGASMRVWAYESKYLDVTNYTYISIKKKNSQYFT